MGNLLLIVDPQQDFCTSDGALSIPGANKDMDRLSAWIKQESDNLDSIAVTLDMHSRFDISHPCYWKGNDGSEPSPFTQISTRDIVDGKWKTANPSCQGAVKQYAQTLSVNERPKLTIWPYHCIVGSPGGQVVAPLAVSLNEWQTNKKQPVRYFPKGLNSNTEHYSAIVAEFEDPDDRHTHVNLELLHMIEKADKIFVAGEASSHCVKFTVLDAIRHISSDPTRVGKKIIIIKDAMSPVPGFEKDADSFLAEVASSNGSFLRIGS